uniref:R3H domain-containing protein n=1 Tax=Rhodosorus marinus TaxID=101924 RepID=A0A7S2ZPN4_9RHOD|mmetsp:Transcript_25540/g.100871  ORF Transcript_25540/g.100871 Transcript_25540/m.100871 type:complete len:284 (+) Transcript_25540:211-1062(+)
MDLERSLSSVSFRDSTDGDIYSRRSSTRAPRPAPLSESFDESPRSGRGKLSLGRMSSERRSSDRRSSEKRSSQGPKNGPKSPRAGTRRLRRFYNNIILRGGADPDDLADPEKMKKLVEVSTPSIFEGLIERPEDRKRIEPFLYVSEVQQREQLYFLDYEKKGNRNRRKRDPCRPDLRYQKIDRKVRELIRTRTAHVLEVLDMIEGDVRANLEVGVVLELDDGMCRMVVHGLAQFYGMHSFSEDGYDGRRLTVVRPTKNTIAPRDTLRNYIIQCHGCAVLSGAS